MLTFIAQATTQPSGPVSQVTNLVIALTALVTALSGIAGVIYNWYQHRQTKKDVTALKSAPPAPTVGEMRDAVMDATPQPERDYTFMPPPKGQQ